MFDLAFPSRTIAEATRRGLGGGADKQLLILNTPPPPPAFCLSDREIEINDRIALMSQKRHVDVSINLGAQGGGVEVLI